MKPRRRFGQHFLRDKSVLQNIADSIAIRDGEWLIEIGPGDGALTAELLRQNARVQAVEIDRDLCAKLQVRFAKEVESGQLQLTQGDALAVDFSRQSGPLRIVGNFPYNISTPLLLKLMEAGAADVHAMVQREVAERLCAAPGDSEYGRLTATLGAVYDCANLFAVAPESFHPPPRVDSTFVRLTRRKLSPELPQSWNEVLRRAFSSRRKTMANALRGMPVNWDACGIDPARRPQTLSPDEFIRLARDGVGKNMR